MAEGISNSPFLKGVKGYSCVFTLKVRKANMCRIILCIILTTFATNLTMSAKADEPTWLFTVPKAESLEKGYYNVGLLYADFGIAENLELGIHGVKYSMPQSNLAFGVSFFPMASAYLVVSQDIGSSSRVHLGLKSAPYIFFAGFEAPVSSKVKFVAELTNGAAAGIRIFPAENWTLDIFAAFITVETYRYRYARIEIEHFYPVPGILFAYSGRM